VRRQPKEWPLEIFDVSLKNYVQVFGIENTVREKSFLEPVWKNNDNIAVGTTFKNDSHYCFLSQRSQTIHFLCKLHH
jgi:hypothetical protein